MISIVIPTKNDKNNLVRLFKSLEKYKKKIDVMVVDDWSNDGTEELVRGKGYRFIGLDSTPGYARNIGIKYAKYNKLVMLDADTEVCNGWYEEVERSLDMFDIVAGYSPDPYGKDMPRVPIMVNGQDITYPQCNIAYNRSVFDKVGLISEDMSVAEDCELHYRCAINNLTIFYNYKMMVYHHERKTFRSWVKKCVKNGFGRYELEKIHPDLKHLSQHGLKFKSILRLGFGALGYLKGRLFGGRIST